MAVILTQTLPEGVPIGMLDAVTFEMDVAADPPTGLIVHTHFQEGEQVRIVDVWESAEAYEKFAGDRLRPAMEKVAAKVGFTLPEYDESGATLTPIQGLVRGR